VARALESIDIAVESEGIEGRIIIRRFERTIIKAIYTPLLSLYIVLSLASL